ncbi:valine--pyruvate transaminase [Aeromonas molluscorum]|jgi:valine--pyruvate aminotransferase|uniref:Valine--pyruvate transaminase n=1 Tax=Aeromonas molluscorum 848 TaxID=1268236 RepID=R1H6C8_9GAMM|nr:valine--pyruvate transaminase [Aeromonas molluscorum]EOD53999.1 valine--pyruvate transaminase [Aeromonas molluscorum 848]
MEFSVFGEKFTRHAGITQLMDDLNQGLTNPNAIMLGGGNPAPIPAMLERFQQQAQTLLDSGELIRAMANYDGPQGKDRFTQALAKLLKAELGWDISARNIALTNGSQTAFFYLFNLLAGEFSDGRKKKILFPLAPEYIGYGDSALTEEQFVAYKPTIEKLPEGQFKYHVDFERLEVGDDIGAICVSRPTNPTGNVLTDEEIEHLDQIARDKGIPLILDNAYGVPFPGIIFSEAKPFWNSNTILCMSLSKLGLPGTRCGIVIANEQVIQAMTNLSGIINLAPGSLGPALTIPLIESGEIIELSEQVVKPFYRQRADLAVRLLRDAIPDPRFHIHKPEGALFLWLWFEDLPIHCQELYERLKQKNLLIVPGHYFFPGIEDQNWRHSQECIRLNYAQNEDLVRRGVAILAEEINALYGTETRARVG